MKVAVTSSGQYLESNVDPRFGRCPYLMVVDTETMSFEPLDNQSAQSGGGAGIQTAKIVIDKGVSHVLTGNCGPNAHKTLNAADIAVVCGCEGTIREVVKNLVDGKFRESESPNVESHHGLS